MNKIPIFTQNIANCKENKENGINDNYSVWMVHLCDARTTW